MTAYNTIDIHNKLVRENAAEALHYGLIDDATYTHVIEASPVKLYIPNYFIRIGLGILTVIAGLFSCFLLGLLFDLSRPVGSGVFLFFMAALSYTALELFVNSKKYHNAGIDNALQLLTIILLLSGCWVISISDSSLLSTGVCFIVCSWMCYRFIDAFTSMMAYLFFFLYVYFLYIQVAGSAVAGAPFLMMAVSAGVYFLINSVSRSNKWLHHKYCTECIKLFAVVTFYISGNYFVVSEVNSSNVIFITSGGAIPPPWMFWVFTICTPVGYLLYGINKRSLLFIRVGILALAATVLTIRYYHTVIPADAALMLAGGLLIAVSYALIRYLHAPKYGYSFVPSFTDNKNSPGAEAVIIAQAFGGTHASAAHHGTEFGGGQSGGGGATGDF